jgi:hypothetical protein
MVTTFGSFSAALVMHALSSTESSCAQHASCFNSQHQKVLRLGCGAMKPGALLATVKFFNVKAGFGFIACVRC